MSDKTLLLRSAEEIILDPKDLQLCMGSGELLPCPFCGARPISAGEVLPNGKFRWQILCSGPDDPGVSCLWNNCAASVWGVKETQEEAREMAVKRWNRRVE